LLLKVFDNGKRLGCSVFKLSTPRVAFAAQHDYRKVGFNDVEEYPESEVARAVIPLRVNNYYPNTIKQYELHARAHPRSN
jgi:hypothetical protein